MATPRTTRRPRHVVDTWYDAASDDPTILQIWAYTTRMSWRAGETLELCVSTNATTFDLELGRDGKEYVSLHRERELAGQWHASPDDCSVIGCGWPVTWSFRIPEHWKPGGYLITLTVPRRSARGNLPSYCAHSCSGVEVTSARCSAGSDRYVGCLQ